MDCLINLRRYCERGFDFSSSYHLNRLCFCDWISCSSQRNEHSPICARLLPMPIGLARYQETGQLHFLTFSCVRRRPILGSGEARDIFTNLLERSRELYGMDVHGYVVMPEHVHLLVAEPERASLALAIQILKQRFSKTRTEEYVWEPRYYDFNVRTAAKRIEKLRYIHRNPVTRRLVAEPEDWQWSSFRGYRYLEDGPVKLVRR
jgi:putative transposase